MRRSATNKNLFFTGYVQQRCILKDHNNTTYLNSIINKRNTYSTASLQIHSSFLTRSSQCGTSSYVLHNHHSQKNGENYLQRASYSFLGFGKEKPAPYRLNDPNYYDEDAPIRAFPANPPEWKGHWKKSMDNLYEKLKDGSFKPNRYIRPIDTSPLRYFFRTITGLNRLEAAAAAERIHLVVTTQNREDSMYDFLGFRERTFEEYFCVSMLYIWMIAVRLRGEDLGGKRYIIGLGDKIFRHVVSMYWRHLESALMETGLFDNFVIPKYSKVFVKQYFGMMVAYDEALVKNDDVALAEALWRNMFHGEASTSAVRLEQLVVYVRRQLANLDKLDRYYILNGYFPFDDIIEMFANDPIKDDISPADTALLNQVKNKNMNTTTTTTNTNNTSNNKSNSYTYKPQQKYNTKTNTNTYTKANFKNFQQHSSKQTTRRK